MQIAIPATKYNAKFSVAESGVSMENIGGGKSEYLKLISYYIPNTILKILFVFNLFPVELKNCVLTTTFNLFVVFLACILFRRWSIASGKLGSFMRKGEKC